MENSETNDLRSEVRDHVNFIALGLIVYSLISLVSVLPDDLFFGGRLYWHLATLGTVAGVAFMCFLYRHTLPPSALFVKSGRRMSPSALILILIVFFSAQMVNTLFGLLLEHILNAFGLSMATSMSAATATSATPAMLLYAAVIAPVAEEVVYRGFCLRLADRFGHVFSILFSSLAFAVMHENIPQALFAFHVGLILGYVTLRYSIHWAIALHFINNFLLGDLADYLTAFLSPAAKTLLYYLFFGMMLLASLPALLSQKNGLAHFVRTHRARPRTFRLAFSSVLVITLLLMHLIPAVLLLDF